MFAEGLIRPSLIYHPGPPSVKELNDEPLRIRLSDRFVSLLQSLQNF